MVELLINGTAARVPAGVTVAAALATLGHHHTRLSERGAPRAPVCGMGVCQECRVGIDGRRQLACQTLVRDGMRIVVPLLASSTTDVAPLVPMRPSGKGG